MAQSRVVLRDEVLEVGERLRRKTKTGSLTELIAIMFSRYGRHLEETWEVVPIRPTYAQAQAQAEATYSNQLPTSDFSFDEPLTGL
jgi:hypothetical protein